VPNVPSEVLNPRDTWEDKEAYDKQLEKLSKMMIENFKQFEDLASKSVINAGPVLNK